MKLPIHKMIKRLEDRENFTPDINYDTLYMGFKYYSVLQKMYKYLSTKNVYHNK